MARFVVSIVSPPGVPHSETFRELAQSLVFGLRALGHQCDSVTTDHTRDDPGVQPIVLGWNLLERHGLELPPAHAWLYQLEQAGSAWLEESKLGPLRRAARVLDWAPESFHELRTRGGIRVLWLPIGYVPQMTRIEPRAEHEKDIDVLFYGSACPRRQAVLDDLRLRGLEVVHAFGVYGEARDALIARARVVLNMHYEPRSRFEWVRVSYLLANSACVLSEAGPQDAGVVEELGTDAVQFAELEDLARVGALLARPHNALHRRRLAAGGLEAMRRRPFPPLLERVI